MLLANTQEVYPAPDHLLPLQPPLHTTLSSLSFPYPGTQSMQPISIRHLAYMFILQVEIKPDLTLPDSQLCLLYH